MNRYVALLRGINVGGRNKVGMNELKTALGEARFENVATYIASGNVLLSSPDGAEAVRSRFEEVLRREFEVDTRVLVKSTSDFCAIARAIPEDWQNDTREKSDVLFLFPEDDDESALAKLKPRKGLDDARWIPGAILWHIDRAVQTRSALSALVGTPLYRAMTIRNVNTVRRLLLMIS